MTITIDDVQDAWDECAGRCCLSRVKLTLGKDASLDRVDSKKGYIKGNIQWVHKTVNLMKSNIPQEIFLSFCKQVALY